MKQDAPEQGLHFLLDVLLYAYTVQAVRPACHWWHCPRVLAWFRVRMVWSLVKPPARAGSLSRRGDYLLAAQGPELLRRLRRRPTLPYERAATRGPPDPLFHRRLCLGQLDTGFMRVRPRFFSRWSRENRLRPWFLPDRDDQFCIDGCGRKRNSQIRSGSLDQSPASPHCTNSSPKK